MRLVSDANIFIDMAAGELLGCMFGLKDEFIVPKALYLDELRRHHSELPGLGLRLLEASKDYVEEAFRLGITYNHLGVMDTFVLALAKQERCPLLTGDAKLREAAEQECIETRGTLWVVGRLLTEGLLNVKDAGAAYEKMKNGGRRLPWLEVDRQLKLAAL